MKMLTVCSLLIVFIGCGKSEDELRKIIQDEMSKASRSYVTSAQVIGPYTPAVKVGNLVFISGQVGISQETGELVGIDTESQTKQALMNLLSIAKQAGCDSSDIVQCSVFLRDIKDFSKMNIIYGGFFAEGKYPTRATVEVSNLPRNAKVEIAAIAVQSKF
ncbi:MAG: Rid family detoxifying hydrolase [Bacteroidota bacterium]